MKYCPYCGTPLQDDMAFCRKCGKKYPDEEAITEDNKTENSEKGTCPEDRNPSNSAFLEMPVSKSMHAKKKSRKVGPALILAALAVAALTAAVAMVIPALPQQKDKDKEEAVQPAMSASEGAQEAEQPASDSSIAEISESVVYLEIFDDQDELVGTASGFLVKDHSTLATNYHVMEDAYRIVAWTSDGAQSQVISQVIAYDAQADLAILRCEQEIGASPLTIGNSDLVEQGDPIYAVGYPLGLSNTLSDGIVSSRYFDSNEIDILQITAPVSSGSSGGALLNQSGEVIGVVSASYIDGQNMNIAIASNMLAKLLENTAAPTNLSEIYQKSQTYGNSTLNVSSGPFLAESEEYYYFVDGPTLYAYNKTTQTSKKIDDGECPNVYKGKLYYVASDENDLCCTDLDGKNKTLFGITDTSNHTGMSWSHDRSILNLLVAEDKLFLCIMDRTNQNRSVSLYVYDRNSLELLFRLDNTSDSFAYYGSTLYIGTETCSIYAIDMKTLTYEPYATSFAPDVGGVDNEGNVYYTDIFAEVKDGIYELEIPSGKETVITAVKGSEAVSGISYDFFIFQNQLHLCEFVGSEFRNSIAMSNDASMEWGDQTLPIAWVNAYANNQYLYTSDGTTIDADTGQIVGTWVFG